MGNSPPREWGTTIVNLGNYRLTKTLTRGRCYYWPCSKERPVYEGVIDDEEFTSYLYPCDAECWEIVLDPTGMAARALAGDADTLHAWYPEMNLEEHFNKS